MKAIPAEAYEALADAVAKIMWHKQALERYLRLALREQPELLAGLPFAATKREVANELVDQLSRRELRYRDFTLSFMLEIANIDDFPNIRSAKDRPELLPAAREAVDRLARIVKPLAADNAAAEQARLQAETNRANALALKERTRHLSEIKSEFLSLESAVSPQQRGRDFEKLLDRLFIHYDLEPRLAYNVAADQIDGAISFDSDDYIVEAKWTATTVERHAADAFAMKVSRSGKNGLGLFVSSSGFSSGFKETYARATPFITLDGVDLYAVLDDRFRLDDLLRAKKRHANETGSCFLPVSALL